MNATVQCACVCVCVGERGWQSPHDATYSQSIQQRIENLPKCYWILVNKKKTETGSAQFVSILSAHFNCCAVCAR